MLANPSRSCGSVDSIIRTNDLTHFSPSSQYLLMVLHGTVVLVCRSHDALIIIRIYTNDDNDMHDILCNTHTYIHTRITEQLSPASTPSNPVIYCSLSTYKQR